MDDTVTQFAKQILKSYFPNIYFGLKDRYSSLTTEEVDEIVYRALKGKIVAGPFAGMRYLDRSSGSALAPKLLGTYERELIPTFRRVQSSRYDRIIDIGSAEGYYAVGLALTMPNALVDAFDIDDHALGLLGELAQLNSVTNRLMISRKCGYEDLNRHQGSHCLVICDIEGAELELLDPTRAIALLGYDLVVEVHDGPHSTRIHDALVARFGRSHDMTFVRYEGRTPEDCPADAALRGIRSRQIAVDEMRTFGIEWAVLTARASRQASI